MPDTGHLVLCVDDEHIGLEVLPAPPRTFGL